MKTFLEISNRYFFIPIFIVYFLGIFLAKFDVDWNTTQEKIFEIPRFLMHFFFWLWLVQKAINSYKKQNLLLFGILTLLSLSLFTHLTKLLLKTTSTQNEISELIRNRENDLNKVMTLLKNDKILNKNKGTCIKVSNLEFTTKNELTNIIKDSKYVFLNGSYGEVEVIFKGWHLIHNPRYPRVNNSTTKQNLEYPYFQEFPQNKVWFINSEWQLSKEKIYIFGYWV